MAEKVERTLFVVTGNRLDDGRVQYLRADGSWGHDFDAAELIDDAARRDALVARVQREHALEVSGIYAIEVGITASGERVLSTRERLRAAGEVNVRRRLGVGVER